MQARIETRGPNPPEPPAGPARLGFHDMAMKVSATTQVIDLGGQALPPHSLASLWTLLGESGVLRRVSLGQCEVGADQASLILDALLRNQGSLTSLNLKKNHLDDSAARKLLGYPPEAKLCKNRLRHLDLRGNRFSAATGKVFARAVLPPPPAVKAEDDEEEGDRPKSNEKSGEKAGAGASTSDGQSARSAGSTGSSSSSASSTPAPAAAAAAAAAAPAKPRKLRGKAKFRSAGWLTAMVAGGPAKCSRFDEFNGVPTEKLIRGETTKKKRRSIKHLPHLELSSIEINKLYLSNCPLELDVACVLHFECTFIIEGPCTSATPSHTCSFFVLQESSRASTWAVVVWAQPKHASWACSCAKPAAPSPPPWTCPGTLRSAPTA